MSSTRKRSLRLSVAVGRAGVPVLIAAVLLPSGCAEDVVVAAPTSSASSSQGGAGAATTTNNQGGSGGEGGFVWSTGGAGGEGGVNELCPPYAGEQTFTVDVPPEGTPAEPGQICAISMSPVQSNKAARVTLTKYSEAVHLATGFVAVEAKLLPDVVGLPTIELVQADDPKLGAMKVSMIAATSGGFSFNAEWPPFDPKPDSWSRVIVKVRFELTCPGNQTRFVEAQTVIHLCLEEDHSDVKWVSSGDECNVCDIIAEMAPSPIVPDGEGDDLPLGRALALRLVVLARVGASLVVLAENDGGPDQTYEWRASGGEVARLAADIVTWTPADQVGAQQLQAAVFGGDGAAVASLDVEGAALREVA